MGIGANQNAVGQNYYWNSLMQPLMQAMKAPAPAPEPSMIDANTARAKAAYDAVLASLATSPAYNQSAMFPGLDLSGYTQYTPAQTGSYGAGRFTGGLLNAPSFNFNAPSK
jgi:hypothetical protein